MSGNKPNKVYYSMDGDTRTVEELEEIRKYLPTVKFAISNRLRNAYMAKLGTTYVTLETPDKTNMWACRILCEGNRERAMHDSTHAEAFVSAVSVVEANNAGMSRETIEALQHAAVLAKQRCQTTTQHA